MKTPARFLLVQLLCAFGLLGSLVAAEENAAPPSAPPAVEAAPAAPAAAETSPAPAASEAPGEKAETSGGELRRLDVPETPAGEASNASDPAPAEKATESAPAKEEHERRGPHHRRSGDAKVAVLNDARLEEDESADAVVSIFGSSTAHGQVQDAVVSIFGSSTATGGAGNAVVSILGSSRASGKRVGDVVVSILGNTYVDCEVGGAVVSILGNVELGPKAVVHGEVVCIGGTVTRDASATVHGQLNNVAFGPNFGGFEWLHAWVKHCLLLGRPLAFAPHLMWAWWIAIAFLVLYVVLALLFPRGVEKCATTLETNPGYSILTALLITLLTPLAAVLLAITIVGAPALVIALFIAGLFGKAVMLAWIGRRITLRLGGGAMAAPAVAVLLGGVILLLLYTVPVVGFVVAKLTSWLGLGAVGYTMVQSNRRQKVAAAAAVALTPASGVASAVAPVAANPDPAMPAAVVGAVPVASPVPPAMPVRPVAPVAPVAAVSIATNTLPRAGFWIRVAASLLDVLLVGLCCKLIPDRWEPNFLLILAGYSCALWGLKGTTIGGIICGLKVVRVDGRALDWPTAIVRALAAFLSFVVVGIGFIWVAFDDQKQSWHDKIAGTTIVHVPKGVSLV